MSSTATPVQEAASPAAAVSQTERNRPLLRRTRKLLTSLAYVIGALALGVIVWELIIVATNAQSYILPTPLSVWNTLVDLLKTSPTASGGFWQQLWATLEGTLLGFVVGCAAGVVLGILAGEFRVVRQIIYPYLVALQSLPKVALVPVLATWFGFGLNAKIALVVLLVFFPVLVNTFQGVATADPEKIDLVRSLRGDRWQQLWRVRFFSAMPYMFTGFELGIVYAFLGAVLAEMTGAQSGTGVMIEQFQTNADTQATFAMLIVLAVVGLVLNTIVRIVHKRVVFWEQASAGMGLAVTN
ncbi:MAG TPA: ABC transporter permease [Trebonia sp.]|jgi:NitT/TauT family transport system permease protein